MKVKHFCEKNFGGDVKVIVKIGSREEFGERISEKAKREIQNFGYVVERDQQRVNVFVADFKDHTTSDFLYLDIHDKGVSIETSSKVRSWVVSHIDLHRK